MRSSGSTLSSHWPTTTGASPTGVWASTSEPSRTWTKPFAWTPCLALLMANRGLAHLDLGQLQQAIDDFNESIRLNPKDANTYAGRAIAHILLGEAESAQRDVDGAIAAGYDASLLNAMIEEVNKKRQ